MPRGKREQVDQIILELREAELELSRGKTVPESATFRGRHRRLDHHPGKKGRARAARTPPSGSPNTHAVRQHIYPAFPNSLLTPPPALRISAEAPQHFCRGTSAFLPRFISIPAEPVPFLPLFFFSFFFL